MNRPNKRCACPGFFLSLLLLSSVSLSAQPALTITARPDRQLEVRWTNSPAGLALESTSSLLPPAVWSAVQQSPVAIGDLRLLELSPADAARFYRLRTAGPTRIEATSPLAGEAGVSLTRETILRFSNPLAAGTQIATDRYFAEFGGRRLLSRVELSGDRRQATLFHLEPLPAGSRVQVSFVGDGLRDNQDQAVDADGDGQAGGTLQFSFNTMTAAAVPGTAVFGHVFASDPVPSGNGVTNRPLNGVIITVDGAEERLRAVTDETGFFQLAPCPAGRFFVHIDGRTAAGSDWPNGEYYPFVGKTFEAVAGSTNNPAGGTGEVFLPLVKAGTLQTVSPNQATSVTFPAAVLAEHPELAGVSITVPPNALYSDNGTRGGRVGIAPVAPNRIPSPLPAGLDFPLVITIQTDGPSNFDQPVPVRFPNLPDPATGKTLPPGAKSALWSYDHDTGRWEIQGSMTVTADGKFVETDPGVGVRQPGWHSSTPGSTGGGGGAGGGPCDAEQQAVEDAILGCAIGAALELAELAPAIGCGISIASSAASAINDCSDPTKSCAGSLAFNGLFGAAGCIPGVGTFAGALQCSIQLGAALGDLAACQSLHPSLATAARRPGLKQVRPADDDDTALQDALFNASRSLIIAIYNDSLWMEAAARDEANMAAFGQALVAALDPSSEEGARISAGERTALLALPAPDNLSLEVRNAALDRFDRFAQGGMTAAERGAILEAATSLQNATTAAQQAGWTTMLDGLKDSWIEVTSAADDALRGSAGGGEGASARALTGPRRVAGGASSYGPIRSGELLYRLTDQATGFVRRGRTAPNGQLDQVITAANREYVLTYLDPATLEVGSVFFRSGDPGDRFELPMATLVQVSGPDADQDGLPDRIEDIVGTLPTVADTDNDGTSDSVEVRERRNPLDGIALPQGVVASLPLGGSTTGFSNEARALGLCVDDSRVFVANGKRGLAVVDATDPLQPLWLGSLDLLGESLDISYAPAHQVAALVASAEQVIPGERGLLHFVDVADPRAPRLLLSYSLPSVAVDHWNGLFYVALGQYALKEVRLYDAASGLEVGHFALQDYATGIRVAGGRAYVATLSGLEIFDAHPGALNRLGRLAGDFTPEMLGRAHLILDGTTLYVGKTRGVATVDVTDPAAPKFIGVPPATTGAVRSFALNGGPRLLALMAGLPTGNPTAAASLSIYDASDPANTTTVLFGIGTPGRARDVALLRGFAAVADDTAGLTIVNFADADLNRQGPTISFDPASLDVDPVAPGIQIKEGSTLQLAPRIVDDVQLDRAELWVDGALAASTRDFPVSLGWIITNLVATPGIETNLVLQLRALDRSGNERRTDPVSIQLVRDLAAPVLAASLPAAGQAAFAGQPFVLEFDKPVDALPLNTTKIHLLNLGADAAPGGGDDTSVPLNSWSARESIVNLHFADAPGGRYQLTLEPGAVLDRASNALAQPHAIVFDRIAAHPGTAVWIADADGLWSDPANWLHGRLPSQDDDVVARRFGARPKVTLNTASTVKSLSLGTPFVTTNRANLTVLRDLGASDAVEFPDDSVQVSGSALFEQALTLSGGSLTVNGTLETRGLLTLTRGGALTLDGPDAHLQVNGGIAGSDFSFTASGGAVITLPGFATYDGPGDFTTFFPAGTVLSAWGFGSRLTLPDMTTASGPVNWNVRGAPSLRFQAANGGQLELPKLTTLSQRVFLQASGDGSVLNAPALQSLIGTEAPFAAGIEASFNGRAQLPALTTLQNCPITERDGGVVVRP